MQQVHPRTRANLHRSKTDATHRHHAHQYSQPRRTETHIYRTNEDLASSGPWQHMAQNFTWVSEQEFVKHEKQTKTTNKWILENQIFVEELPPVEARERDTFPSTSETKWTRQKAQAQPWGLEGERWAEMFYAYELEADRWMKEQEQARRRAVEMERAKAKLVQEELRRIEMARQRQQRQREAEKRRMEEERLKYAATQQERELKERAKADKAMLDAWTSYEDRWKAISSSTEPLTYSSIPWPMAPSSGTTLTSAAIVLFLYSPVHSRTLSRKERLRNAQLRWHPDRFRKVLERVAEEDKSAVEESVGVIARCLNDLMSREAVASRHQKAAM